MSAGLYKDLNSWRLTSQPTRAPHPSATNPASVAQLGFQVLLVNENSKPCLVFSHVWYEEERENITRTGAHIYICMKLNRKRTECPRVVRGTRMEWGGQEDKFSQFMFSLFFFFSGRNHLYFSWLTKTLFQKIDLKSQSQKYKYCMVTLIGSP